MAWVEASLPKRTGEGNVQAVEIGQAHELIRGMVAEACEFVTPDRSRMGHRVESAKIVRLDLVRDFDEVRSLGNLLDGLAGVPQHGRVKVARHADPERARAETLAVGPKSWRSTLYDKHAETAGIAPEGRLRFEGRMHAAQLRSVGARNHGGHLRLVGDLEEEKCRSLRRWMFDRVGFGREVVAVGRVQELIFRPVDPVTKVDAYGMTKAQQRTLWAFITAGQRGADIGMSRHTVTKYKALAREVGVTLGASSDQYLDETRYTLSLDFDRGTETLRAA